jgi:hypothetical protein
VIVFKNSKDSAWVGMSIRATSCAGLRCLTPSLDNTSPGLESNLIGETSHESTKLLGSVRIRGILSLHTCKLLASEFSGLELLSYRLLADLRWHERVLVASERLRNCPCAVM